MGILGFLTELVVTRVDTATPDDTIIITERGHSRYAPMGDYDGSKHQYLSTNDEGFHTVGEKEHPVTGKGAFEAALGLFLGG